MKLNTEFYNLVQIQFKYSKYTFFHDKEKFIVIKILFINFSRNLLLCWNTKYNYI